jgi:hypothetical protein
MTTHFDFLLDDPGRDFFQRVAVERVAPPPDAPAALTKQAKEEPLDKLAAELDADLQILEGVGDVGLTLGMTKRALRHLARLGDDERLLGRPGVAPDLFGKIAAAAVAKDIAAAARELGAGARGEVTKIGLKLATELEAVRADLEKRAAGLGLAGLGRAGLVAKELRGASNLARGAVGAAEEGLGRLGRQWRAGKALDARANVRQIGQELRGTEAAGAELQAARGQMKPSAASKALGANRAVVEAQKQQLAKAQSAYAARRGAAVARAPSAGAVGGASPAPGGAAKPAPASAPPASAPAPPRASAPTTAPTTAQAAGSMSPARAEAERRFAGLSGGKPGGAGKTDAPRAARMPEAPDKAPAAAPGAAPGEGEGEAGGSIVDAVKKLHTHGWSALQPHEKKRLLTGGVGLIGAHRLLTGRDLLTGDKND